MGYDLYGVNPKGYDKGDYPTLSKWENKTVEEMESMSQEENDLYWKEMSHRDSETGSYFRANVWWWRRLWIFTTEVCDSVMTDKDKDAGNANDHITISESTCKKMLPLMEEAIKQDRHKQYEEGVTKYIEESEKDKDGNYKEVGANYPFSAEFFEQFTDFVSKSGGFKIG